MNAAASRTVPAPTEGQLLKLFPRADEAVVEAIAAGHDRMAAAGILANHQRLAMFIAQCGHESGGLAHLTESLSYSAERAMAVWPGRFPTLAKAQPVARNPEALANSVYGGRMGNTEPGDGWKYRGRGLLGLTGGDAYRTVGDLVGEDLAENPDLVATPQLAFTAACGVWIWKKLSVSADREDVRANTLALNGGNVGLDERRRLYALVKVTLHG